MHGPRFLKSLTTSSGGTPRTGQAESMASFALRSFPSSFFWLFAVCSLVGVRAARPPALMSRLPASRRPRIPRNRPVLLPGNLRRISMPASIAEIKSGLQVGQRASSVQGDRSARWDASDFRICNANGNAWTIDAGLASGIVPSRPSDICEIGKDESVLAAACV